MHGPPQVTLTGWANWARTTLGNFTRWLHLVDPRPHQVGSPWSIQGAPKVDLTLAWNITLSSPLLQCNSSLHLLQHHRLLHRSNFCINLFLCMKPFCVRLLLIPVHMFWFILIFSVQSNLYFPCMSKFDICSKCLLQISACIFA